MAADAKEEKRQKEFGKWLRKHREALGLTQTQAGRAAGMSRTQWTRIEMGLSGTKRENIPAIAKAVGADLAQAYDLAGFSSPSPVADEDETVVQIYNFSRQLPPETRQTALEIIEALWNGEVLKGNIPPKKNNNRKRA